MLIHRHEHAEHEGVELRIKERVAWAIHESKIPIMTGVGHETDVTIADFVADHRAPTPSAAAELVSPNILEKTALLTQLEMRLVQTIENR